MEKAEGSKIRAVSYPYNEYLSQLTLKLGGGETTGAVHLDIAWLAAIAQMGKLAELDSAAMKGDTRTWRWRAACTTASSTVCRGTPARSA